jgi:hypothetical protein
MPSTAITGFLYFPTAGSCNDTQDIPESAKSAKFLPSGVNRIAVVPNGDCINNYLMQADSDGAIAAILYNYDPASPLSSTYSHPLYGISSNDGQSLLNNIGHFSKDVSSVPNNSTLSAIFNPTAIPRLDLTITPPSKSSMDLPMIIGIAAGGVVLLVLGIIIGCKTGVCWNRRFGKKRSNVSITL